MRFMCFIGLDTWTVRVYESAPARAPGLRVRRARRARPSRALASFSRAHLRGRLSYTSPRRRRRMPAKSSRPPVLPTARQLDHAEQLRKSFCAMSRAPPAGTSDTNDANDADDDVEMHVDEGAEDVVDVVAAGQTGPGPRALIFAHSNALRRLRDAWGNEDEMKKWFERMNRGSTFDLEPDLVTIEETVVHASGAKSSVCKFKCPAEIASEDVPPFMKMKIEYRLLVRNSSYRAKLADLKLIPEYRASSATASSATASSATASSATASSATADPTVTTASSATASTATASSATASTATAPADASPAGATTNVERAWPPELTPEQEQKCREFITDRRQIDAKAWPDGIEFRVASKAHHTSNVIILNKHDGSSEKASMLGQRSSHVFLIKENAVQLYRTYKNGKAKAKDKDGKRKRGGDDSSDDGSDVSASGPSASAVAPIEDRLRRLNEMLDTGLISQQAHAAREAQILQEL